MLYDKYPYIGCIIYTAFLSKCHLKILQLILDTHFQHNFALYLIQSNKYHLFPLAPMHTNGLDNTVLTFLNNVSSI